MANKKASKAKAASALDFSFGKAMLEIFATSKNSPADLEEAKLEFANREKTDLLLPFQHQDNAWTDADLGALTEIYGATKKPPYLWLCTLPVAAWASNDPEVDARAVTNSALRGYVGEDGKPYIEMLDAFQGKRYFVNEGAMPEVLNAKDYDQSWVVPLVTGPISAADFWLMLDEHPALARLPNSLADRWPQPHVAIFAKDQK